MTIADCIVPTFLSNSHCASVTISNKDNMGNFSSMRRAPQQCYCGNWWVVAWIKKSSGLKSNLISSAITSAKWLSEWRMHRGLSASRSSSSAIAKSSFRSRVVVDRQKLNYLTIWPMATFSKNLNFLVALNFLSPIAYVLFQYQFIRCFLK